MKIEKDRELNVFMDKAANLVAFFCGLFVLLPFKLKPYTVFAFVLLALFSKIKFKNRLKCDWKSILIYNFFTICCALSLFYSNDLHRGFTILGRYVPLLLIPIAFSFLSSDTKEKFNQIFIKTFILASCLYSVLIFIYLFKLGYFSNEHDLSYCYSYITFEFYGINEHPIYISVYFSIALLLLLIKGFENRIINVILFLLLISGLFILSRKGPIISFFIVSFLLLILKKERLQLYKLIVVFIGVFSVSLFIPEIKNRFLEVLDTNKVLNNSETSTGIRKILWKNSWELIQKSDYLGYGIGDVQEVLRKQLAENGFIILSKENYNAHNEYLQMGLAIGFLGFLLFLSSFFFFLFSFIKKRNSSGIVVFLFFSLVFLFESFLERQNGIIIYSFITCMFIFSSDFAKNLRDET
ncbi:O-antigen ligase family protein [Flavobacterium taihuense]|uniref:O-antigen ligase family protein n=1 Tax=Flavobacterium taihuense TaxID=2857508 RepID=A0ABS6XRE8_9FLAO|nr:O-antigen ligase family protein [Flavobacterium taihuense]MBW4358927.1 O-antigen ligase family protein [Flavobacterium taihuense]